MIRLISITAALLASFVFAAACEEKKVIPAQVLSTRPTTRITLATLAAAKANAKEPATQPTTRPKGIAIPNFPPDGTYADGKKVIRIATGSRQAVSDLLGRHANQLAKAYKDPAIVDALMAFYDKGAARLPTTNPNGGLKSVTYVGAMILLNNPPEDSTQADVYFLFGRSNVVISKVATQAAEKARGEPIVFHTPVEVWYSLDQVHRDEPDPGEKPEKPEHFVMMSATHLSLMLRVNTAGKPGEAKSPPIPCVMFANVDSPLLLDKLIIAPKAEILP